MMLRRALIACSAAVAMATALPFSAAKAEDPLKVGFIYVGPIGDHGWTYRHDIGRLAVEEAFGDKVETTYVESVPEGADAERVLRTLAQEGHDLIFSTSFGYMNAVQKVAKQFPDVKFEHATGYKRGPNVSTYNARFYEGRAILGHLAGHATKSNTIGYIASFPIPEVIRGINALTIAARKVNPDVTVKVVWVNTWYDPGKEADAAKALIDQGADIITQHTDSPAPLTVAQERGVLGFGQASDMSAFAPDAHLTSIIDNWDPYYVKRTKDVLEGTWESIDIWEGIAAGKVEMASYNEKHLSAELIEEARAIEASIVDGSFHPFQGPINNQDGSQLIGEGEVLDEGTLLGMNYYVEGVEGSIPQ